MSHIRIATVLDPFTDRNLALAAQCGVDDVVLRYPGTYQDTLANLRGRVESFGMRVSVIEGFLPIEEIKLGTPDRDREIQEVISLVREMGDQGVEVLCYNMLSGSDWSRTSTTETERGGALVTAFDRTSDEFVEAIRTDSVVSGDQLWDNLQYFLDRLLPVAEEAGVALAMHPDDPPLPSLGGQARIMWNVEAFERLIELYDSPSNAVCFCQGTFAEAGVDVPKTIRRLGPYIRFVHFRDVKHAEYGFVESFHDNGDTDMLAAMRAYHDIGFDGPMRPDHVPQLSGEENGSPGYTMMGRLFAFGYMRGLIQAVASS